MRHLFTRALVAATLLGVSHSALAQVGAGASTPPIRSLADNNGVDLATGAFRFDRTDIAIGPANAGGLTWISSVADFGSLSSYNIELRTSGSVYYVVIGGQSDQFTPVNGVGQSQSGTGATLTLNGGSAQYITRDGLKYNLSTSKIGGGEIFKADSIIYPDGNITNLIWRRSFYYRTVQGEPSGPPIYISRLEGVTSNRGYAIKVLYSSNFMGNQNGVSAESGDVPPWLQQTSITAVNTAINACVIDADAACVGRITTYAQTAGGLTVTNPNGDALSLGADAFGRLASIAFPLSSTPDIAVAYNPIGRVQTVTKPSGIWQYSWTSDASQRYWTVTITDPTNVQRIVKSDILTRRILTDTVAGRTTTNTYDTNNLGWLMRSIAPEQNRTDYTYDGNGNVLTTVSTPKPGSPLAAIQTSASYYGNCAAYPAQCNKPLTMTDANGAVTNYSYDTSGNLLGTTLPAGQNGRRPVTTYAYTGYAGIGGGTLQLLTSTTSASGAPEATSSTIGYGGSNLEPTTVTTGNGLATITLAYDANGDATTVSGPISGMVTRTYRDQLRRVVGVVGPDPDGAGPLKNRATQTSYDHNGRVTSQQQGTTTNQGDLAGQSFTTLVSEISGYDAAGRRTSLTTVAGGTTVSSSTYSYNQADRPVTSTLKMNNQGPDRTTSNAYDGNGLLSSTTTASGTSDASIVSYTYTLNGKLATLKDGKNNTTSYAYDGFDRLQTTTYPATATAPVTTEVLGYDAASNVLTKQRRGDSAATLGYTYDPLGNLKTRTAPGLSNSYTYDTLGRLTSATGGSYNVNLTWDALGDLLTDTTGTNSFTNSYDAAGRRTGLHISGVPNGWAGVLIDYLATGDIAHFYAVSDPTVTLVTFGYDDFGHETQVARTGGGTTGRTSTFTYGTDQRLASISHTGSANGTYDVTFGFTYNNAGQITGRTTSNDAYVYGASAPAQSFTPNNLNQLTSTATPFSYDQRGNQYNATLTPGASRTFDGLDRVTSASAGGTTTYLTYDALDRLAGVQAGAGAPVRYLAWNGDELDGEWNGNGGPIFYAHDNEGRPIFGANFTPNHWINGTDYLTDERGSLVGESDGTVRAYAYDAYGREATGAQHPSLLGYAGGVALPGAGLVHFRARAYDTATGRWVSADPIGAAGGINIYGYVGGDPVNNTDPSGLAEPNNAIKPKDSKVPGDIVVTASREGWERFASEVNSINLGGLLDSFRSSIGSTSAEAGSTGSSTADARKAQDEEIVVNGRRRPRFVSQAITPVYPVEWVVGVATGAEFLPALFKLAFGNCFIAGTLVDTADGLRPIETIRVADLIVSRDPATGATALKPVVALNVPHASPIAAVTVETPWGGPSAPERIETTDGHPWRTLDGRWVPTIDLKPGQLLWRETGRPARVVGVEETGRSATVYNVEIADWHTYFVGNDKVWVHNASPPKGTGRRAPIQRCTGCGSPNGGGVTSPKCADCYAKSVGKPFYQALKDFLKGLDN